MKNRVRLLLSVLSLGSFLALLPFTCQAQGTAFTYQGRLSAGGTPAQGAYDFQFTLFDAAASGTAVGAALDTNGVPVSDGLFSVTLDFGANPFSGPARWLEIGVKSNGVAGPHFVLAPRQALKATPYAIFSGGAQTAVSVGVGGVNAAALSSGAVNGEAIADGTIGVVDLSPGLLGGTFWRLDGNAGGGSFLGSTDNQPVEFRANNEAALRLLPRAASPSLVGGHASNTVNAGVAGAFIGGGGLADSRNLVSGGHAAIVGGYGNQAHGSGSAIGGGLSNFVQSIGTFVGGGSRNAAGAPYATISGGLLNTVTETNGTIGGGYGNFLGGTLGYSTIGGGAGNRVSFAQAATIGGGMQHQIVGNTHSATVGGGYQNFIKTNGALGTIAGGSDNLLTGYAGSIGGGMLNVLHGDYSTLGGGRENEVPGTNAVVSGGIRNVASGTSSSVGGGTNNTAGGLASVIGGGLGNSISTVASGGTTIAGGSYNRIESQALTSAIGGGTGNAIETYSQWSVIAGGANNASTLGSTRAVISGGQENRVTGSYGTIPGGYANEATNLAFAAGIKAKAVHEGAWVWADGGAGDLLSPDFASTRTNQFLVRASGGVGINTNNPQATLHVRGNVAADALRAPGAGVNTGTFAFTHRATAGSIIGHITTIDHPLCNDSPTALLLITHNWSADTSTTKYHPQVVGLYYNGARWTIFHEDNTTPMEVGDAFNVMVIKP